MKKNKMMRAASFLLVAVLLTTSVISGTFAKYVTSESATDSARVAKWGVEITANGSTFAQEYATNDPGVMSTIAKSVVSTNADKLVAPGTGGSMVAMTLAGIPEVAVNVAYDATLTLDGWSAAGGEYCPIVFTVDGATYGTNDTDATNKSDTIGELITAVEGAIEAYSANYPPHIDLSVESTVKTPDVSWSWPIETGADNVAKDANNLKDTELGDAAADGNAATISLQVTTTVTQID